MAIQSGGHRRHISSHEDYAYSSTWGGELSVSFAPSPGWRRGLPAGFSSCGFRYRRRWSIGVEEGVGMSGLMSSIVPMSSCLNLKSFADYIGSHVNYLGKSPGCKQAGVWTIWLLSGWLCENQPVISGLY